MIVVIDGYNVLKQIFPNIKGKIDKERNSFIRQLGYYKSKKSSDIKDIIVVFDAGPFGHATREVHEGVVVIFSGQKSSADDWIIEYVENHKNEDLLIVTMDRKIIRECEKSGATTLGSIDFYGLMQSFLLDAAAQEFSTQEFSTQSLGGTSGQSDSFAEKYDPDDDLADELSRKKFDRHALDLMMEQASLEQANLLLKKEDDANLDNTNKRKGVAEKLSKKERRVLSKIKKLH
jgi:predicted RNA-binding protein with PIN domain